MLLLGVAEQQQQYKEIAKSAAGNHGISREIITSSSKTVAQILTDRKARIVIAYLG